MLVEIHVRMTIVVLYVPYKKTKQF